MERKLKSPELLKAKKKLIAFIEDNNLNPSRDYSNHLKYGKEFSNLLFNLTKERQKIEKVYPELDRRGQIKHIKMIMEKKKKKAAQKEAARELKGKGKGNVKITEKKKKETKETNVKRCKYDYPLVNGHEMSPDQKKKYRMEQRKLANGGSPKPKVEKEETKTPKASKKKEEKVSKVKKTPKVDKVKKTPKVDKVKKTKKKVKKEED